MLTLLELANLLRAPVSTARTLVRTGQLRHQRIGRRIVVDRAEVQAWIAGRWQREGNPVAQVGKRD